MNVVKLTSMATILSAAAWVSLGRPRCSERMGMRGAFVRLVLESVLARRTGVPPSDVSPDFGYARLGLFLADLPRGRHRQAWP